MTENSAFYHFALQVEEEAVEEVEEEVVEEKKTIVVRCSSPDHPVLSIFFSPCEGRRRR